MSWLLKKKEDNDGSMNDQVNETEGLDSIKELQQNLINQVADVDQQIRMLQEASDSNTVSDSNME
jgi:hypothetical protein